MKIPSKCLWHNKQKILKGHRLSNIANYCSVYFKLIDFSLAIVCLIYSLLFSQPCL